MPEYQCLADGDNPNNGLISFDSYPKAMFTLYMCTTLDGWTNVMYMVQDAWHPLAWIYFVLFVVLCVYFSLSLVLAAIW